MVASRGCYARCAYCCIAAWHEQTSPGKRFRLPPVEDVADEMAFLQREEGRDLFIFQDDNFFLPRPADSLARIEALASALGRRMARPFAIVVKARPDDVRSTEGRRWWTAPWTSAAWSDAGSAVALAKRERRAGLAPAFRSRLSQARQPPATLP